jgi:hypothetical protein
VETRTVSTFGHLGNGPTETQCSGSVHCGEEKWIGGVLTNTGKIIGIPYGAETVLEIDPAARTTTTFGIVSSTVKRKWVDGVLARNGLIYAIPYDADVILEIDSETRALMLFGRVGGDPCKWYGGVLGPNDKIYTIPYSSPYVLEIDPERRLARPFAMTYPHWAKWTGGVLAPVSAAVIKSKTTRHEQDSTPIYPAIRTIPVSAIHEADLPSVCSRCCRMARSTASPRYPSLCSRLTLSASRRASMACYRVETTCRTSGLVVCSHRTGGYTASPGALLRSLSSTQ